MYARTKLFVVCILAVLCVLLSKDLHAQSSVVTSFLPSISTGGNSDSQETEEQEMENRDNQIRSLIQEGLEEISTKQYSDISYNWISQNSEWIYGYVLATGDIDLPQDAYNFLVKIDGKEVSVAYQYTGKFDGWLDIVPENIIQTENRPDLYSSEKYKNVFGLSTEATDSEPSLSFPWAEGISWRYSSGPHNEAGPAHLEKPWSGIDFGLPYGSDATNPLDQVVISALDGTVTSISADCYVIISNSGGWGTRYLHIKEISVKVNDKVVRGQVLGKVPLTGACGETSGPHLHLDLRKDGKYVDFNNHYIGGWLVTEGSTMYQGSLSLGPTLTVNASTTRYGKGSSYIENRGYIADKWYLGPYIPKKPIYGVGICNQAKSCYFANQGTYVSTSALKEATKIIFGNGYKVEFRTAASFASTSSVDPNTPTATFSCLDFDVTDLQNYNFPGTEVSLRDNSTETIILLGPCNPNDRPTKKGITTPPGGPTPPPTEPQTNYGCSNQTTGVKFRNKGGSCFYMTAGKASLPFSPTSIEVIDTIRKYDISICNAKGQCDEFNNTADIDHSSVSRPFTRVEVTPQGLVSTDAVGSCQTSTGRRVEFATMQAGVKYHTDRNYTVKNVDKVELIGMRFLKTPNDDKLNGDPEYITCDIKKTTQIIIAIDNRTKVLPGWMRGLPYERINREIGVTDNDLQHFNLYSCTQQGGYKLRLGGPQSDGAAGGKNNFIIIFREVSPDKATDCSAKFNVAPDMPVLKEISTTTPIYSAPLLEWSMSDRNFTGDPLQAYVKIWQGEELVSSIEWLPIGVTQWIPPWNDVGIYKAQVVVHDSKGLETVSNQISYQISATTEACVAIIQQVSK